MCTHDDLLSSEARVTRGTKGAIAVTLLLTAVGGGIWAWIVSQGDLARASGLSGVLQGFLALLAVPGLVFAGLALRSPPRPPHAGSRLKVTVTNMIPTFPSFDGRQQPGDHFVGVEVANIGDRTVAVTGWGIKLPDDRSIVVLRPPDWATPLPHELRPGAPPARFVIPAQELRELHRVEGVPYSGMRPYVSLADGTKVWSDRAVPLA